MHGVLTCFPLSLLCHRTNHTQPIISGSPFVPWQDRLYYHSDAYTIHVCDLCGLIAIANLKKKTFECKGCSNTTEVRPL